MQAETKQKFGLIIPKKNKINIAKSVFKQGGSDDDDDQTSNFNLSDQSKTKTFIKKQTQLQIEGALLEDANIFDYDGSFEADERRRREEEERRFQEVCQASKPKYMGALLRQAEERKRERLVRGERKVAKERKQEEEEGLFQDKERYETEAYKESRRKMEEEQRQREEALQEVDSGDFSGFYKHLFDQKTKSAKEDGDDNDDEDIQKNDRSPVNDKRKDIGRDIRSPKQGKFEYEDRKERERKRDYGGEKNGGRKDKRETHKRETDKRETDKRETDKRETDKREADEGEADEGEVDKKVLPSKHTADISEARVRYLARLNKPL